MTIPDKSNATEYSRAELEQMIANMEYATSIFYTIATGIGCHPFIEFTGIMNEYIKICKESLKAGINFPFANTHTGITLQAAPWHIEYLYTKLDCIFGPTITDLLMNKITKGRYPRAVVQAGWKVVAVAIHHYQKSLVTGDKNRIPGDLIEAITKLTAALPNPMPRDVVLTPDELDDLMAEVKERVGPIGVYDTPPVTSKKL